MPELPEVEHMSRLLHGWLVGQRVTAVALPDPALVRHGDVRALEGATVQRCWRRAKLSILETDRTAVVLSYRMTGKVVLSAGPEDHERRVRLRLERADGAAVLFDDTRRLGEAWVLPRAHLQGWLDARGLGPDCWPDPPAPAAFGQRFAGTRAAIKPLLLQPARIAGIGNIGATEALWRARIDPRARAGALEQADWTALRAGVLGWVEDTLAAEDQPEIHWVTQGGPNPFAVYGRAGGPCPRGCGPLVALKQAGRTTTWCPGCQRRGQP